MENVRQWSGKETVRDMNKARVVGTGRIKGLDTTWISARGARREGALLDFLPERRRARYEEGALNFYMF